MAINMAPNPLVLKALIGLSLVATIIYAISSFVVAAFVRLHQSAPTSVNPSSPIAHSLPFLFSVTDLRPHPQLHHRWL